jgi:2-methylisocitrate lyase-like PEP mutase family enzyme
MSASNRGLVNPEQIKKAEAFRAMHSGEGVLLLPNVWDIASARIIEEAGFPAIATTSAGIAFARGFPDGQKIHRFQMFGNIRLIARAVKVPVTADVEAGYGDKPEHAASTAGSVILQGAVGLNLEDATGDAERPLVDLPLQLEKIQAIRESAEKWGVPLVLNARTDVYLLQVGDPARRYDESLRRMQAFRDAGADCVFIPGVRDATTIGRFVADLRCPVNVLAAPGSPSVSELAALGVKRVSLGSGPMRATLGLLRRLAQELRINGTYATMEGAPSHAEMNALMSSNPKA